MHLADLVIYVNEILGADERAILEEELRKVKGVIAPRFNRNTPHLVLVAYDPEVANSRGLLDRVESKGYTAQLVAM